MITIWKLPFTVMVLIVLIGCTNDTKAPDQSNDDLDIDVEERILAFNNTAGYAGDFPSVFNTYYLNGSPLPYVDLHAFIELINTIDGPLSMALHVEDNQVTVYHESAFDETTTFEYQLEIDLVQNQVTSSSAWFGRIDSFVKQPMSNVDIDSYARTNTEGYTINLDDYYFQIYTIDDSIYLPFHLANLLFSTNYVNLYYNHDELYLFEVGYYPEMRESSQLGSTIPEEIMDATYHYMRLWYDYFYGLNGIVEMPDSETFFEPFYDMIYDPEQHYEGIRYAVGALDDIHAQTLHNGMYSEAERYTGDFPATIDRPRWDGLADVVSELNDYCETNHNGYQYLSEDTVIMHLASMDQLQMLMFENNLTQTIYQDDQVETIILDLSCNLGGSLNGIVNILGLMTDETLTFTREQTMDGTIIEFTFESNQNPKTYTWYILVSPYTYSAANMFTSLVQSHNLGTIIGQPLAGGASSLDLTVTPSGMPFTYSSPLHMTTQSGASIEFGIPIDIELTYDLYDDLSRLLDIIGE